MPKDKLESDLFAIDENEVKKLIETYSEISDIEKEYTSIEFHTIGLSLESKINRKKDFVNHCITNRCIPVKRSMAYHLLKLPLEDVSAK